VVLSRRSGPGNRSVADQKEKAKLNLSSSRSKALLLLSDLARRVDIIYIDPPYNSGARDWKYNNNYVDKADRFRHSKWLSMMKKRLLVAKRLLKPDGVIVITIDENEVYHLGMLLEELFPSYLRHMVNDGDQPEGDRKTEFCSRR
jgi:adenine-specific DNA-methyltransferase